MLDFYRIACAVPQLKVADVAFNAGEICRKLDEINSKKADFAVFPELSVTGYTCGDLFLQSALLDGVAKALVTIARHSANMPLMFAVGAPLELDGKLFDCAVVFHAGEIVGIVPKSCPLESERRWFAAAEELYIDEVSASAIGLGSLGEYDIPVGVELLFDKGGVKAAIEIGSDCEAPIPPSVLAAVNGAQVILCPAASFETATKRAYRRNLISRLSASAGCAYAYCSAGADESTTDFVFSGHSLVAECGRFICENDRFIDTNYLLLSDVDLGRVRAKRLENGLFKSAQASWADDYYAIELEADGEFGSDGALYPVRPLPFVPSDAAELKERCESIFSIQVAGLKKRIEITSGKVVIGVSGGLDSTLALLVCCKAMRELGRPLSDVVGITLPCFGTSGRTYSNALELMKLLGITAEEINIKEACRKHCEDIGHNVNDLDVTFENIQARERTQVLMDYACKIGGFVVGTGDLSELALGWCTYNGDHMSMYGVNGGVPKTLIRYIIAELAKSEAFECCKEVLADIVATPISPELLPPDNEGGIAQETESIVGPYELHDFFLYYMVKYGFAPKKVYHLALVAFVGKYDADTVKKWMRLFYKRFFTQQFKRNCQPDGVKVGGVGLSPRGDWKMPSDAAAALWLSEIDNM